MSAFEGKADADLLECPLMTQRDIAHSTRYEFSDYHGNPTDRLGLSMENPVSRRDFEGIVVNLVDSSTVAQAKRSRSSFGKFERLRFCPFLIFKSGVFFSVIV